MTKGKGVMVHQNAPKANKKMILKRTPRMKVTCVRQRLFPSPDKVINISANTIESSSRINQASPTYTPMSPYKKSLNELFDEIDPVDITLDFLAVPVKTNGARITEVEFALFDPRCCQRLGKWMPSTQRSSGLCPNTDQTEIFDICNMNMFRLLSLINRANQILKFAAAERDYVIQAALANKDPEIKRLCSEIAFKDTEIKDLGDDLKEYH
ncbi:hypothetical protein MKX03_019576 [Papaver bracteatum]|nr:hypothetical protein MKX03_019576 [Papaver bracteatum]